MLGKSVLEGRKNDIEEEGKKKKKKENLEGKFELP